MDQIRSTLFEGTPFNDMDLELIELVFTPACRVRTNKRFIEKYKTCNHQSLEFYGDRILYGIVSDIIYDLLGLAMSPHDMTNVMNYMTTNAIMTILMNDLQMCQHVPGYKVKNEHKHNSCADTFEALIGAMFMYCKSKNLHVFQTISDWLMSRTKFPHFLSDILTKTKINATVSIPVSLDAPQEYHIKKMADKKLMVTDKMMGLDDIFWNLGIRYLLKKEEELLSFNIEIDGTMLPIAMAADRKDLYNDVVNWLSSRGFIEKVDPDIIAKNKELTTKLKKDKIKKSN